nr:hypothetical protein [Thioalkalivibrio sp. ALJ1]
MITGLRRVALWAVGLSLVGGWSGFGCTAARHSGMQRGWEGEGLLRKLAELNNVADACEYASCRADIDPAHTRIMFYD